MTAEAVLAPGISLLVDWGVV